MRTGDPLGGLGNTVEMLGERFVIVDGRSVGVLQWDAVARCGLVVGPFARLGARQS